MITKLEPIKLLEVRFGTPIRYEQLSKFRGAIIHTTKQINDLFHNHNGENVIYRYPQIQYKRINGKAAILCLGEGVEAIHDFFSNYNGEIMLGQESIELKVEKIKAHRHTLNVWDRVFSYRLANWLPLNQENYLAYRNAANYSTKMQILENVLIGNLLTFCQSVDDSFSMQIRVEIVRVVSDKVIRYKGQLMQAFDLDIQTNLSLPDQIGIGKGTSLGFGVITRKWE
ncbi:CRISPR-associated endonuclease Cas6 [Mangrovibacterium sp.]|uniref:CRISPR-associated endonuclease Cas6 n=1 Tax=Mangrovibacterium sp. TaxID=1961364 RepID=UPI003566BE28